MKFEEFKNFREYDRKCVKVTNVEDRIKKIFKIEELQEPLYGVLYIDKTCGVTLRILGNKHTEIADRLLSLRADGFKSIDFEIFEGNEFLKDVIENQINAFYYDEKMNELLLDNKLDEFRHEIFPEDVLAILPNEEQPEKMWVRLVEKINEDNLYIAELLDDSYIDQNYTIGKMVALVYYIENDFKGLIINGIVE